MVTYMGHKVSPVELAKLLVEDKGSVALEFWSEFFEVDCERMTEREIALVDVALERQMDRVRKLLNFDALRDAVLSRPEEGHGR